jgi:outer membrane immunogenic protein
MKKILLSTVAFVGLATGALAADLPARTVAPAPIMAAPVFTWTGFYIGGHVGYGFGDDNDVFTFTDGLVVPAPPAGVGTVALTRAGGGSFFNNGRRGSSEGFLGGGQVGFNVQTGMFVFGVEADVTLTDFGRGRNAFFGDNNDGFGLANAIPGSTVGTGVLAPAAGATGAAAGNNVAFFNQNGLGGTESIDYFGTIRGRVGVAFDRMMIYATGGLAWAEYDNDGARGGNFRNGGDVQANFFVTPGAAAAGAGVNGTFNNRGNFDDWGYAVGGGIEYAFTNNISAKIEGLYVDFGDGGNRSRRNEVVGVTNTGAAITATNFSGNGGNMDFGLIRGGLNFRFNTF